MNHYKKPTKFKISSNSRPTVSYIRSNPYSSYNSMTNSKLTDQLLANMPEINPNDILQSIFDLEEKKAEGIQQNNKRMFQAQDKKNPGPQKKFYCVFNERQPDIISDKNSDRTENSS